MVVLLQVYGKDSVFDADRLIDLLAAFEDFSVASKSARGDMDVAPPRPGSSFTLPQTPTTKHSPTSVDSRSMSNGQASTSMPHHHNGAAAASASYNGQARSSTQYSSSSKGNGSGMGVGSYSGVNKTDGKVVANSRGNDYQASISNGAGRAYSNTNNGAAMYSGRVSNGHGASNGSGVGIQPYGGQGSVGNSGNGKASNGQHFNGQGQLVANDRASSGQHAGSSSGQQPWGSWGSWGPQVPNKCCISNTVVRSLCCSIFFMQQGS